ncbi:hypothetical protein XENTR_v10016190 [Xenopus tropicalis]|nr:hypothetical protein XENTR_v10016190 [Xenopus tropicalis]
MYGGTGTIQHKELNTSLLLPGNPFITLPTCHETSHTYPITILTYSKTDSYGSTAAHWNSPTLAVQWVQAPTKECVLLTNIFPHSGTHV